MSTIKTVKHIMGSQPSSRFKFWAWAASIKKLPDGSHAGVVKRCYHKGDLFGPAKRVTVAQGPSVATTGEALKWARAKRRELNAKQPGVLL